MKQISGSVGTGSFQNVRIPLPGIHHHLVATAKWVGRGCPRLHKVTPVKHLRGFLSGAPSNPCWLQLVDRTADSVGNSPDHEFLIIGETGLTLQTAIAPGAYRRVRVRAGNQHVIRRNSRLFVD